MLTQHETSDQDKGEGGRVGGVYALPLSEFTACFSEFFCCHGVPSIVLHAICLVLQYFTTAVVN